MGPAESMVVDKLLAFDSPVRDALSAQKQRAEVQTTDRNGGFIFKVAGPAAKVEDGVVSECFYLDGESNRGALVHILLHVANGRLHRLEIYKEGGEPILVNPYKIPPSLIQFY